MCARTAEYEEELWGPKEEKEPQRQLLDAAFNLQPRIVLRRADITKDLRPDQQEPEPLHIKEEVEDEERTLCCDRRVKMCARTAEYEEELWGPKEEKEPQRQLLDAAFNLQPRIVLRRAGVSENLHPERQQSVSPHIKENEEVQHIKEEEEEFLHMKEEEQEKIIKVPSTGVPLKSEDEGQSVERRGAEPPNSNSSRDGDHCGGSQTDGDDDVVDEQLEGDMTCHTVSKCWKCSKCRKTFASKKNFKRHMKIHTGEKPFACSVCGQRFSRKGTLKSHTRTHTGEKPFACSVCGQRFSHKGHLTRHTRTHTGEKPFSCSVCGQRFYVKSDLKIHTRTHTGEKPFGCSVCGQRFSAKSYIKIHTRTHTGEKPFVCSVCGQRFSRKGHLTRHTRTHTGEKPFSCSGCGQRFSRKDRVKTHNCSGETSSDQEAFNANVNV
ncbi:zinc finger protein 771-like isoform X1 [Phycodurus eques]|uniref:zinc finger protein 771-like isoform X1 n=2 Tax=Phycodurus eques TaxID=693459 RepID=UPI002ACD91A8|nr:zinc finger protein 771-like isoform X1 [Phycodurus eques]